MNRDDAGRGPDEPARGGEAGEVELSAPLRRMVETYHPPPPTPRDAIWATIERRLPGDAQPTTSARSRPPGRRVRPGTEPLAGTGRPSRTGRPAGTRWYARPGRLAAAIALVAVGFGAGRVSLAVGGSSADEVPGPSAERTAAALEGGVRPSGVDEEARDYLTRSGTLLASVRSDAREGVVGPGVGPWGRGLLQETRIMLDSPAAADPAMRALLEDLELVLAQVALLSDRERVGEVRGREELRLIARGVDSRELLPRIHAALPAGTDLRMEEGDR